MTAPKELHERIDQLSPEGQERLRVFLEREAFAEQQDQALLAFAEGWTPEEEAAFEAALSRRMKLRESETTQG